MTPLVPTVLFGWIGVCVTLFAFLPPSRAVILAYMGAWMFLPNATYALPGLPDFDKTVSASLGIYIGILLFDYGRLKTLSLSLWDWPVIAISISPFLTSLSNGLGAYDGFSAALGSLLTWAPAYLCGRLYLTRTANFQELGFLLLFAGLIYMPLCWIEIRFSPQLHKWVYGYMQHSFAQHIRYDGYRPIVFMQHGLMVAFWMATATIAGYWMWRLHKLKGSMGDITTVPLLILLFTTTILCKSLNAIMLMAIGLIFFSVCRKRYTKMIFLAVLLAPPCWIAIRASGLWDGESVKTFIAQFDEERAGSLAVRMKQEDLFSQHARERLILGWGGWMRMFPVDSNGQRLTRAVDGLWVIMFGKFGLVGLLAYLGILIQGPLLYVLRISSQELRNKLNMPLTLFALIGGLYAQDCLFNAMLNPVFLMSAAGLLTVAQGTEFKLVAHLHSLYFSKQFRDNRQSLEQQNTMAIYPTLPESRT